MNFLFKLAPHAAILIGNMYYVFWGIDRVNKTMNFIDNEYTKFLLVLLCIASGLMVWRFSRFTLRQMRRWKNVRPLKIRLGLLGLQALLAGVIALLLLCDLFVPDAMLFLNEFVKVLVLILCLLGLLNGLQLILLDREIIRASLRRAARNARPAPARPAAPVRQAAPARQSAPVRRPAPPARPATPRPSTRIPENRRPAAQNRRTY
ncbi:MAG: hypothetical protein IJO98_06155 [Clostridia bacterium]|nr:hypothetical protein [Clostridia bacterium]